MTRGRSYDCFACGHVAETTTEAAIHAARCPEAGKSTITRAVACWACAGEIDLRVSPTCPACGFTLPGGTSATEMVR